MTGATNTSAPAADGQQTPVAAAQGTTVPARSSQSTHLYDIDKLDNKGSNFTVWKSLVSGKESCPDQKTNPDGYANWLSRDEDATTQITLTLSDEPLSGVMHLASSTEVWDKLARTYEGKGKQTVASPISELFRDTLSDDSAMQLQLDAMLHKKHLLSTLDQPLDDSLVAIAMVISLPPSYSTLCTILMSSDATLSTDKVITSILEQEKLMQAEAKHSTFAARLGKGNAKHDNKSGKSKGDKPKCAHCKKLGHKKDECRKLKAELAEKQKSDTTAEKPRDLNAKVARASDRSAAVLRIYVADVIEASSVPLASRWIVDSGASAHMSSERVRFCSYRTLRTPHRVWLGDKRYIHAVGEGSMYLDLDNCDNPVLISRVYHVPELHGNLLSVSCLAASGYTIAFVENGCRIVSDDNGAKVGSASLRDGLYILNGSTASPESAHLAALDPSELENEQPLTALVATQSRATVGTWHSRLGHLSVDAVLRMVRKGMVEGMSLLGESKPPATVCTTCLAGKQTRDKIPSASKTIAPRPNYRISSDLMESDTCSPLGEKYLDTYIDQYSRHISAYPLKAKSDQPVMLDAHINRVEVLVGQPVNYLRSDGGGEYDNRNVKDLCARRGIHHEMTNPDTPQENGIAERTNRTIKEMALCMLQESGLPKKYWAEATKYAVHILNRTPTRALAGDITPHEAYTGIKPSVAHIRPFGCKAYVHIPAKKRSKFDAKSLECVLLGYCKHKRAYRLLHRPSGRILESRDVVFDEGDPNGVPTRIVVNVEPVAPVSDSSTSEHSTSVIVDVPATSPPSRRTVVEDAPDEEDDHSVKEEDVEAGELSDRGDDAPIRSPSPPPRSPSPPPRSPSPQPPAPPPANPRGRSRNAAYAPYPRPIPLPEVRRSVREKYPVKRFTVSGASQAQRTSRVVGGEHQNPTQGAEQQAAGNIFDDEDAVQRILNGLGDEGDEHAYHASTFSDEPRTYQEAMSRPDAEQWKAACAEELLSFAKAELYDEVERPRNRKVVDCKWVFRIKHGPDGKIQKYKARLVAKGFTQVEGVDYTDTFAPVTKFASIRMLLAFAAKHDLEVHQMDVKSAFLNGDLEEEIFMEAPPGFQQDKAHVWRLQKSLYGLKQASREWYKKVRALFESLGYSRSNADHSVFYKRGKDGDLTVVAVYVDDMLIFAKDRAAVDHIKLELGVPYEMSDLGEARWILGMEIIHDRARKTITLSQHQYVENILKTHGMANCRPVSTPMAPNQKLLKLNVPEVDERAYQSALGSLMYAMLGTRPDLAFAVGMLSKHAASPGKDHWTALMRVYKYLRGTSDHALVFDGSALCSEGGNLVGYSNADWAGDVNDRRSVTGFIFKLGDAAISWQSKKQDCVALSTTEAEYIALAAASKEALWLRTFLSELYGMTFDAPGSPGTLILVDNQSAMSLAKNSTFHDRTKHIAIRHHFIRDEIEKQAIHVEYIPTGDQVADILTKALARELHERFARGMGQN
ncbi:hypothetical protein BN946_scf184772.g6 [Trametes cinnabarina]|uniref:Integrase catalytic domain-containing protein n=1 Tax=Pycnoporus cinnabarinus TaxID=5643 RepID=A0A060SSE0_PYCCI|nr:hypothetical protein BN946_scf184772.g6 [Trametes cinnabarina]